MIEGVGERTGGVPLFVEEVTRLLLERGDAGRRAGDPADLAAIARRAARPARRSARGRADRRGAGARFFLPRCSATCRHPPPDSTSRACKPRSTGSPKPTSCSSRAPPPTGDLSLQARADPGRGLREPAQEPPPGAAPPRGRGACASASAEPEAIAHHFTEAGLDDLAIEWWGKAGDQALRRSAFQEAIAHLGKAIAMADKAGATARRATGGSAAASQRLTQLHVAYGNALIAARGYRRAGNNGGLRQSPRVGVRATRMRPSDWRPTTVYGSAATCGANLPSMRTHAAAFLSDVEARPNSPEAGVAHRVARDHSLVRRRVSRSARSSGTRARSVPTRPRRRSGLSLRAGRRRRRDGLSGDRVVAARRGRARGIPR